MKTLKGGEKAEELRESRPKKQRSGEFSAFSFCSYIPEANNLEKPTSWGQESPNKRLLSLGKKPCSLVGQKLLDSNSSTQNHRRKLWLHLLTFSKGQMGNLVSYPRY